LALGKLFGAPAEAFFMALVGVPFALAAGFGGDVSFSVVAQCEVVVFVSGLTASALGLLCSSVVEKTAHSTGVVVLCTLPLMSSVVQLNVTSLWAASNPVFVLRALYESAATSSASPQFFFFGATLPVIVGFVLLHAVLIGVCVMLIARRMAEVELSFMTPRQGLAVFAILQILLLTDLVSQCSWGTVSPSVALRIFHGVDFAALLALAFALTPGAELVRGRVSRGKKDEHWKIVFERTNQLQDSPALRAMLDVCGLYVLASLLTMWALGSNRPPGAPVDSFPIAYYGALMTLMNVGAGIAMTGLLLYIQVYTEMGCFKLGLLLLVFSLTVPPMGLAFFSQFTEKIAAYYVLRVNPVAYFVSFEDVLSTDSALHCPLCCAVLGLTFCTLAALRIRFLLDLKELALRRAAQAMAK
jgi:hypothetical protein